MKLRNIKPALTAFALLAFSSGGSGNTTVQVRTQDVTATQAIIRVHTDQSGSCTYRLSEGSTFENLVNDVNPRLFAGANSDARTGSILNGTDATRVSPPINAPDHVFVAGTRTATKAADGHFYSRALQANTRHWVGVTCGSDAEATATFQTLNPPLGDAAPERMPFEEGAFGNVAVPSIDWTNRAATYIDPTWGTQLHRMTDPTDLGFYAAANAFTYALSNSGRWASPNNALSGGTARLATCDTAKACRSADALALIAAIPSTATNYATNGSWDPHISYLDFLVRLWGSATDASPANRTVTVCWSTDNQTCFTSSQTIVLPRTVGFAGTAPRSWSLQRPWNEAPSSKLTNIVVAKHTATVNFASAHGLSTSSEICINGVRNSIKNAQGGNGLNGCHKITATPTATSLSFASNAVSATYTDAELLASPNFPKSQWASWGAPPLHSDVGARGGGAITAFAGLVSLESSGQSVSNFDVTWRPGTKIYIGGSAPTCASNLCTVASMGDAQHIHLVESLTTRGAAWASANFALMIKKATNTGAVSLSASYDFVYSANFDSGLDGSGDICNANYVTIHVDANGKPISPVRGYLCVANGTKLSEAHTPIYIFIPATGETRLIARNYLPVAHDYRGWIGWHPSNGRTWFVNYPGQTVYQVVYQGDFRSLTPGFTSGTVAPGTPEQLAFTDIFSGSAKDMSTQISRCAGNHACNKPINKELFSVPPAPPATGSAIRGNYMVMCGGVIGGGQDSPGYVTMWDIASTPAALKWAGYTFDAFPVGYGGIHACLNFGDGRFNAISLNGSVGQLPGPLSGPWEATPTMIDRGDGYTGNTSVAYTDGFGCPEGLSRQWQELGAKPVAQGGVARCLRFKVPGDFCSAHATPAESGAYPCPWNSAPSYSLIKPIGEGDEVGDSKLGFASYGEKMLVVKVTRNSPTDIDLLVFRYSNETVTPKSNFTCGSYRASEWNHEHGWTMRALPYQSCPGSNYWLDATDTSRVYRAENRKLTGAHSDFGQGSAGYSYVSGASLSEYLVRANQPMPQQIGGEPTAKVSANPTFGSTQLPDVYLQSYPSKRQQSSLAPASEMDWALDIRHYNPGSGNPAETPESLFGNTVSAVSGYRSTYRVTFAANQKPDPKIAGFVAWAGYHMLADASGPKSADAFGDATPWHFCYALSRGECVSGSSTGEMFVSVPFDSTTQPCLTNSYAYNAPCISNNYPHGFWATQFNTTTNDNSGASSRRLTSAFMAPGRQYNFTNAKPTPDGKWILLPAYWLEGQRSDMFWLKLPPFPEEHAKTRVQVQVESGSGDSVRIEFGYAENGNPTDFYCSSREEACFASSSATAASPFRYASESSSYVTCGSGCTITIPAVPGRTLYYRVERHSWWKSITGELQVLAVP